MTRTKNKRKRNAATVSVQKAPILASVDKDDVVALGDAERPVDNVKIPGVASLQEARESFIRVYGDECRFAAMVADEYLGLTDSTFVKPITALHLARLLLWCFTNEVPSPTWIRLDNKPLLQQVLLIQIEGDTTGKTMPFLNSEFIKCIKNTSIRKMQHILQVPKEEPRKNKRQKTGEGVASSLDSINITTSCSPQAIALTRKQLLENEYPHIALVPSVSITESIASVEVTVPVVPPVVAVLEEGEIEIEVGDVILSDVVHSPVGVSGDVGKENGEIMSTTVREAIAEAREEIVVSKFAGFLDCDEMMARKKAAATFRLVVDPSEISIDDVATVESATISSEAPLDAGISASEGILQEFHLLAVDCEMVETSDGLALARLTAVNESLEVVLDTLVKPDVPVRNYLTQFSGITAEMLTPITTTLSDAQAMLMSHMTPLTYLVGHSLENDLIALKMSYSRIIDTAVLYPHANGGRYKNGLKFLAKKFLDLDIRLSGPGGVVGHDSAEDASVAMRLALLKMKEGVDFGVPKPVKTKWVSVLESIAVSNGRLCTIVGSSKGLKPHSTSPANLIAGTTDNDRCTKALRAMGRAQLTCVHFDALKVAEDDKTSIEVQNEVALIMDDRIRKLCDTLKPDSLLIVISQRGDVTGVADVNAVTYIGVK